MRVGPPLIRHALAQPATISQGLRAEMNEAEKKLLCSLFKRLSRGNRTELKTLSRTDAGNDDQTEAILYTPRRLIGISFPNIRRSDSITAKPRSVLKNIQRPKRTKVCTLGVSHWNLFLIPGR